MPQTSPLIGYHASHEQFPPDELLACVRLAEQAGFGAASCSDHFFPWTEAQGESGFTWSWLGAAMQATRLSFGTVNAPGYRYHPAIIAQAAATLAVMFPGRFWIAVGSGEALNEHVTGEPWPAKPERNARLKECVDVMRALWAGETVTHRGRVTVVDAKLYTRPAEPPAVIGAALTPETAEFVGGWADGMVTVSAPADRLRAMFDAFRRGGGEGKRIVVQAKLSYSRGGPEAALGGAFEQWRGNIAEGNDLADLRLPADFERVGARFTPADVAEKVHCSSDLGRHAAWLRGILELGVDALYLHNVNREQRAFIEDFGARVVPELA